MELSVLEIEMHWFDFLYGIMRLTLKSSVGKEDDTIVPADIGQLELVIRKFEERDLDVYSGASNDKEEEEEEGGSGGSQNDTQDEDEEGSGDDSDGDTSDESQDEKYVKPTRRRKLKGTITEFSEYKMAKLRQTHSAK